MSLKQEENKLYRLVDPTKTKKDVNFKSFTSLRNVRSQITARISEHKWRRTRLQNWPNQELPTLPPLESFKVEVYEIKKVAEYSISDVISPEKMLEYIKSSS